MRLTEIDTYSVVCAMLFGIVILIYIYRKKFNQTTELYSNSEKFPIIGSVATNRIDVRPKYPNLAVPFRKHLHIWDTKVPLSPFRMPLIKLPSFEGDMPDFLLYKPELLTRVINQGNCGACWAFMVADVLADRLMVLTGGLFNHNLSTQQLMACQNRDGCNGGSPEEAMVWLARSRTRLMLESKYPYQQSSGGYVDTKCIKRGVVGVQIGSVKSLAQFIPEDDPDPQILRQNILNMKRELLERGPFYCAMTVYEDFMSYSGTEVYSKKSSYIMGGHAIEIIGYCNAGVDPRNGFEKAYWICKSSWGDDWPLESKIKGYFTIEMGKNMCGIESRAGIATPELFTTLSFENAKPITELRYDNIMTYLKN